MKREKVEGLTGGAGGAARTGVPLRRAKVKAATTKERMVKSVYKRGCWLREGEGIE